jgi:hypothetical protein
MFRSVSQGAGMPLQAGCHAQPACAWQLLSVAHASHCVGLPLQRPVGPDQKQPLNAQVELDCDAQAAGAPAQAPMGAQPGVRSHTPNPSTWQPVGTPTHWPESSRGCGLAPSDKVAGLASLASRGSSACAGTTAQATANASDRRCGILGMTPV